MPTRSPLINDRIRKIVGSFTFIEHRFLHDGFWGSLNEQELLLYILLTIVGDRNGLSYYSYDKLCMLLRFTLEEYIEARNGLIDKDLIAFDGTLFQVLSLPSGPLVVSPPVLRTSRDMEIHDPATIHQLITTSFGKNRID